MHFSCSPPNHPRSAFSAMLTGQAAGGKDEASRSEMRDGCAVLLHSRSGASSQSFWEESLMAVDLHFPLQVCSGKWYFSYDRLMTGTLMESSQLCFPGLFILQR